MQEKQAASEDEADFILFFLVAAGAIVDGRKVNFEMHLRRTSI